MQSLETTSCDLETTSQFGTWKRMWESFQRLQQLQEVAATVGSCGDCWKLRRLLEAETSCWRGPQYDGKCSLYILIVIFFVQLQQTETSDRKLFILNYELLCNLYEVLNIYLCWYDNIYKRGPYGPFRQ